MTPLETAPVESPAPAIETRGLTKHYGGTVAVDGLDLRVERGEIFGLLGPNGAGKTTTILMLLGLTEPTAGRARVVGLDPARDALAVKQLVGYLPDDVGFYDDMTGRQNLRYTARLNRLDPAAADERIDRLLEEVDLSADADRPVGGYSRGMRQRLGIADALVKGPAVLVLDEPTVNIDPDGVRHILELVLHLRDEQQVAVILSSHLLSQVQRVCDRIGIFLGGRLVAMGTVDELSAQTDVWEIEVAVVETEADLAAVLGGVPGVDRVRSDGRRWLVTATGDCRAAIVDAVDDHGLHLAHLVHRKADLDAVYHRYFRS